MRGKIRPETRARHATAPERVQWHSGVLLPKGVRLANGHWLLVYNDTTDGRNSLAVSISDDEGKTWKWTKHLEHEPKGSFHYPCVIQARDGTIHTVYSYFVKGGESMKHAAFNEAWVQAK